MKIFSKPHHPPPYPTQAPTISQRLCGSRDAGTFPCPATSLSSCQVTGQSKVEVNFALYPFSPGSIPWTIQCRFRPASAFLALTVTTSCHAAFYSGCRFPRGKRSIGFCVRSAFGPTPWLKPWHPGEGAGRGRRRSWRCLWRRGGSSREPLRRAVRESTTWEGLRVWYQVLGPSL